MDGADRKQREPTGSDEVYVERVSRFAYASKARYGDLCAHR